MGRAMFSQRLTDQLGTVQPYTSVLILEMDGVTPLIQTLYVGATGGEVRTNPLTSNDLGLVVAYADTPQRAIARVSSADATIDVVIDIEDDPADTLSAPIPLVNLAVPTANYVLVSNGAGTAVVGALMVNANVDPAAGIEHSKLASATPHYVLRAAGGGTMGAGLLTNNNIDAAAGIGLGKLAVPTASHVLKSNGTAVTSGFVFDANVDAAAGIAITKIAHVGTGNVLKSNGSANVAGKIATADITADAITTRPAVGVGVDSPAVATGSVNSITTPVVSITSHGGDIFFWGQITASSSVANAIMILHARLDGGTWQEIGHATPDSTNQRIQVSGFTKFVTPGSGAHTIELGWSTSSGTAQVNSGNGGVRSLAFEVMK